MKKRLLSLCFIAMTGAVVMSVRAVDVPSLVVHHYYGNDSYPVSLEDYNKIKIGESSYTLQSPSGKPDITLSYQQYPRFSVENVSADDVVTSQTQVIDDITEPKLKYCHATQALKADSDDELSVFIFDTAGRQIIAGSVAQDRNLSVASLPNGIYIAVASENRATQSIKFAKL